MRWENFASNRLAAVDRNIPVLLAVGAIEQHGAHLPLATDALIASRLCERLDARLGDQVLVLPVMSVGCSEHHMEYCGTLSLQHQSLIDSCANTMESVFRHGFRSVFLLNAHGGNQAVCQLLLERIGPRWPDRNIVTSSWWRLGGEALAALNESGLGGVGHACEFETSLMLHLAPQLVDVASIATGGNLDDPACRLPAWASGDMLRSPRASIYRDIRSQTGNGVFGAPALASAEKGEKIFAILTDALSEILIDLRSLSRG